MLEQPLSAHTVLLKYGVSLGRAEFKRVAVLGGVMCRECHLPVMDLFL